MELILRNKKLVLYQAKSFYQRFKGLMLKKNINYAIVFENCNGIHTFFMKEEIDVILTDKDNNILYLYPNLKPWRILLPKKDVYNTYELPKGSLKNINKNNKIKITN